MMAHGGLEMSVTKEGHGPLDLNYAVLAPHGNSWKVWSRHNTKANADRVLDGATVGSYRGAPTGSILIAFKQYGPYDFQDGYYTSAELDSRGYTIPGTVLLDADDVYRADTWGD
jgi:hypothetical protein